MKSLNITLRKRYLLRMAFLALPFTFAACDTDELLNPVPETSISDKNAFDTPDRIQGQINGLYDALKSGQFFGGRLIVYNEIRGEEYINRLTNGVTGLQTWQQNVQSGTNEVQNLWGAAYASINRINVFLQGLEDNKSKIDPTLYTQYQAEAKFLRALSYHSLVTLYAKPFNADNGASPGLPLRLISETSTANNDLARSTVAQVYAQILKDLNEAEGGLPASYASAVLNTTRAHKNTAIALKTRVYLHMGNYAKVVEEAQKIVSAAAPFTATTGVAHALQADVAVPFANYTTTESVFSMPMSDLDAPGLQNQLGYYFNAAPTGNGEYYLNSAGIVGDASWSATDARRVNFIVAAGGNQYLKKYNKPAPFTDYVPVIRYAEVLLNYAEAAARTNDLAKATDLLSAVRKRSDASYTFPAESVSTQPALVSTILKERRIELLGEGFRSMDIMRTLQTFPEKTGSGLNAPAVAPSSTDYVWPMPNSEIATNKLL
ncbi:SusD-like starch-binding protein associating with outer membrane [Pontibacter ummariensis]|uniref:SusD family protein n=1 Tax=Pontibacter ummariensis TaxID=1610492 RepID=A0A239E9U6_9BACT|nr:RagB/SusD family nutrient uptake outer membrane protein [Pontibacter ummariensis]PRY13127.1 SusD-like starch-binding protein associating with outer membrane [Pontibacter ummariensis]SNS40692.1 SusD family protein [Pontibacter ummariensis]